MTIETRDKIYGTNALLVALLLFVVSMGFFTARTYLFEDVKDGTVVQTECTDYDYGESGEICLNSEEVYRKLDDVLKEHAVGALSIAVAGGLLWKYLLAPASKARTKELKELNKGRQ